MQKEQRKKVALKHFVDVEYDLLMALTLKLYNSQVERFKSRLSLTLVNTILKFCSNFKLNKNDLLFFN